MDRDAEYSDWIEMTNVSNDTFDLTGFWLSDDFSEPQRWSIPELKIAPGEYEVIFCSGKDYRDRGFFWETIIDENSNWKYADNNSGLDIPENWREMSATLNWPSGPSGFGYGDDDDQTIIESTTGLAIRKLFYIETPENIAAMVLHVDYDDGFIAYINGIEIARDNVCCEYPPLSQLAIGNHEAQIYQGGFPSEFPVDDWQYIINDGYNIIAIQVHNVTENSSDMTIRPFLSIAHYEPDSSYEISSFLLGELGSQSWGHYHTNFKLDGDGEEIILSDPNGIGIDSRQFDEIPTDISFGRTLDDIEVWAYFDIPTPLEPNGDESFLGITETPVIFPGGGFFIGDTEIQIESTAENSNIFYTIDGTIPTQSDELFNSFIVQGTTTARFRAFKEGYLPSKTVTHTYFDESAINSLPVISIVTDPEHFFDDETGIYVLGNEATDWFPFWGANWWSDCPHSNMRAYGCDNWERPIHIEFFEPNGSLGFGLDAGVRIHGHWMRGLPQKSLAVIARGQYGSDKIEHQIFPNIPLNEFKSILIRQSGNDWSSTMIRDGIGAVMARKIDLDYQEHRQAIVYINGEYWGIHNVREKINERYISDHHNVDLDNLDLVENSYGTWANYGSTDNWFELIDFLSSSDLSIDSNYQALQDWVDIQEWINYLVIELYAANNDWIGGNYKRWYNNDGKWRFILNDLDAGFNQYPEEYNPPDENIFDNESLSGSGPDQIGSFIEYHSMMTNPDFRRKFINTFADLFNTLFEPNNFSSIVDSLKEVIEPEMPAHIERWANTCPFCPGNWIGDGINSMDEWYEELDRLYDFTTVRNEVGWYNILEEFDLDGFVYVILEENNNEGSIKINSINPSEYPWTGKYFQGNSITVSALPNPGFEFLNWTINGVTVIEENPFVVSLSGFESTYDAELSIEIFFQESNTLGPINPIVINEINYNSSDESNSGDWIELINITDSSVNISNWIIRDEDWSHTFEIPNGEVLGADDYMVICKDSMLFRQVYPNTENLVGNMNFGLSGNSDEVRIFNDQGNLIDSVRYSDDPPWPSGPDGNGSSLELINPLMDNNIATTWSTSDESGTPGYLNDSYTILESSDSENIPDNTYLGASYPNPFNMSLNIPLFLVQNSEVMINIFDLLGRKIFSTKFNLNTGKNILNWSGQTDGGSYVSSGVYFVTVSWNTGLDTKKIICIK